MHTFYCTSKIVLLTVIAYGSFGPPGLTACRIRRSFLYLFKQTIKLQNKTGTLEFNIKKNLA